jgi:hypothetical protein
MLLAERTGWGEAEILSLPLDRLEAYIEVHNELVEEAKRAAEGS